MTPRSGGRPKSLQPFTRWDVHINAALAAEVEMLSWDPMTKKPRYGSRKELLESLLRRWISEQKMVQSL